MSARALSAWILVVLLCVLQFLVLSVPTALLLTAAGPVLLSDRLVESLASALAVSVASSLVPGTIAALALWRLRRPGLAVGLLVTPLFATTSLLAQGAGVESTAIQLAGHAGQGLAIGTICGLLRLSGVELGVLRAAACCGVSPTAAIGRVVMPPMAPGILAGMLFAAVASAATSLVGLLRAAPAPLASLPHHFGPVWTLSLGFAAILSLLTALGVMALRRR